MEIIDKNYLRLQFRDKIYSKDGIEFQNFFESVMEKAFPDFKKIKPYGNKGDGGNDGYRKASGIYYQVYAPETPSIKQADAARKLKKDFEKLKKNWNEISKIKEYYFVFNNKYRGLTEKIEAALAELEKDNPDIKFSVLRVEDLEKIFFKLDESDILSLGFDIDSTKAILFAYQFLQKVEIVLDRENANIALKMLKNSKDIIINLQNEKLTLEYELFECRCLQQLERIDEVKERYENITRRFPDDPRAFLYLAEIYLNEKDFDKNQELLQSTEKIDKNFWLLKLEQLGRKYHLGEKIYLTGIDESNFPRDPKIKSYFYRLYALLFEDSGEKIKADSYIEKAIHANPDRFSNYLAKLSILEKRLLSDQQNSERLNKAYELLEEIKKVEDKFSEYVDIRKRNKAMLNAIKLNVFHVLEDFPEVEKIYKETLELSLNCHFDKQIEQIITIILNFVYVLDDDFNRLLEYIKNSRMEISDELSKSLILQFNWRGSLLTDGKKFFIEINKQKYIDFINLIESKNEEQVLKFLEKDVPFAIALAKTLRNFPELRKKIIENLPDDLDILKKKLLLLLNFDKKDFDEAFNILKEIDLSELSYPEYKPILQIVEQKKAWDFAVVILKKLIEKEKDEKQKFNLQLELFNAHSNLKQYPEVISIGKQLLEKDSIKNFLDIRNKEGLLAKTIIACLERGKIENKYYLEAKELLEKYQLPKPSFEFKIRIEAKVYLHNNDPQRALKSVIEGVKIKKIFSPQEYVELYFLLAVKIGNKINLKLNSLKEVKENTFVKLKDKVQWYYIGDENELDAIKITKTSERYSLFYKKKLGDEIVFKNAYSSEEEKKYYIEFIFPIEKYILWQAVQNFQKLSKEGDLEGVQVIEVPQKGETIDTNNILKFMDDLHRRTEPFFETYCNNKVPLAMLAVNEGGVINAISRIQNEQKGFINFNSGDIKEFEQQKEVARDVLNNKLPFYIDGTSALFLSESGYLKKIYKYMPNVKVPQSVINFLGEVLEKFTYMEGLAGYLAYAQGRLKFSTVDKEKSELIRTNFIDSIKLLESNPANIKAISYANKIDCFSEREIPPELSDACILAQKEVIPALTEDFLYLKMNEIESGKEAPKYFSSLALLRIFYEDGEITFDEYLDYFGYIASYRFRFLFLSPDDIEKAVFGDSKIKIANTQNIRKLNFPLTLSEEYGVTFEIAFKVLIGFLTRVLIDNTIPPDLTQNIFIEIIESFPTKKDKRTLGQLLLETCNLIIEKKYKSSELIIFPESKIRQEKVKRLYQCLNIYSQNIIIP